jgi:hypothetical protein
VRIPSLLAEVVRSGFSLPDSVREPHIHQKVKNTQNIEIFAKSHEQSKSHRGMSELSLELNQPTLTAYHFAVVHTGPSDGTHSRQIASSLLIVLPFFSLSGCTGVALRTTWTEGPHLVSDSSNHLGISVPECLARSTGHRRRALSCEDAVDDGAGLGWAVLVAISEVGSSQTGAPSSLPLRSVKFLTWRISDVRNLLRHRAPSYCAPSAL